MFATRVATGGEKTVCTQQLTGRVRGGVLCNCFQRRKAESRTAITWPCRSVSVTWVWQWMRKCQSLFTPSARDYEIPNAIYHNQSLINAPMTIKHSLHCKTTSLYYVPDSSAATSYFAHDFTSCQSISPTECLVICYVNCTVIVYGLTRFRYNI